MAKALGVWNSPGAVSLRRKQIGVSWTKAIIAYFGLPLVRGRRTLRGMSRPAAFKRRRRWAICSASSKAIWPAKGRTSRVWEPDYLVVRWRSRGLCLQGSGPKCCAID
jgi:hypothetical protein